MAMVSPWPYYRECVPVPSLGNGFCCSDVFAGDAEVLVIELLDKHSEPISRSLGHFHRGLGKVFDQGLLLFPSSFAHLHMNNGHVVLPCYHISSLL